VADGREDGIGGVSGTTFEITATEVTLGFHVADHGLDGGASSQFAFDDAERYLREEAEAKLKLGTVVNYRICVRKHAVPEIGSIKLNRISTADISRIHSKVGQTRPMTANRVVECISSIFRYAATCNLVPVGHNPTKGIRAFRESRRERFLNSDELARLGSAIREAETVGIPYDVDETKRLPNTRPNPKTGVSKSTPTPPLHSGC
jgi:integrase-like protein